MYSTNISHLFVVNVKLTSLLRTCHISFAVKTAHAKYFDQLLSVCKQETQLLMTCGMQAIGCKTPQFSKPFSVMI